MLALLLSPSGAEHRRIECFHECTKISAESLNGEENIPVIDSGAPWKSMYIKQFENAEIQQWTNGV